MLTERWYKEAIVYCLEVDTFQDANGDGVGDFAGLTARLPYLQGLGITCVWLQPFYPSPDRDNGYDITDYYNVDPRYGSLGDFVEFAQAARDRGIRVIVDLVVNHTSDQHPWFQAARSDPESPYRNFYVWSKEKPADAHEGMVFPGQQHSVWTYDHKAQAWYFHRFYQHQPELNIANPLVRREIAKIMKFWLELGVAGFRIDAAPFLIEHRGIQQTDLPDPYEYIDAMNELIAWNSGDGVLLAEANVDIHEVAQFFGKGDRMHMLFNFIANQYLYLALARQEAEPLMRAFKMLPHISAHCQWAYFVRNHDELALERLTKHEQDDVRKAFAITEDMWLYDRGPRRRLPPLLDGDLQRIKMVYSLLFSSPGTPVLRYGEEIGMGDDLSLPERQSVRTPMQWSDEVNGGFSPAPANKLVLPIIAEGPYGYPQVNVDQQQRDRDSLFSTIERFIRARKCSCVFGHGELTVIDGGEPAVFIHSVRTGEQQVLVLHNFSDEARTVALELPGVRYLVDILGEERPRELADSSVRIELEGYGYRWYDCRGS
jgi:maltose alpha-D-glucosyltransferase/alpha-amylase